MKTTTKDVINSIGYLLISYSDQIDQKKSVQKFKEIPPDKPKSKPSKGRGKPMVPQLHPQKGKRQAIVMGLVHLKKFLNSLQIVRCMGLLTLHLAVMKIRLKLGVQLPVTLFEGNVK